MISQALFRAMFGKSSAIGLTHCGCRAFIESLNGIALNPTPQSSPLSLRCGSNGLFFNNTYRTCFVNSQFLQCAVTLPLLLSSMMNATAEGVAPGWTSFRNGGESRVAGELPTRWTPSEGIAWQIETDGYGQSAPVIQGDQVIVTSVIGQQKEQCAITAYSMADGRKL